MTTKTEPTPDWAEQKAAELFPCETPPGWTCGHPWPDHSPHCPVRFRELVAEALRLARANALDEARTLVICPGCYEGNHRHSADEVGRTLCDCGCWWPLKQRALKESR